MFQSSVLFGVGMGKGCLQCIFRFSAIMLRVLNIQHQTVQYNTMKDEAHKTKRVFTDAPLFLSLSCREPQSQGQSKTRAVSALRTHTVYSTMDLHIKWDGREMLKSPSGEVLSTGAWYKKTSNDNLHTLATARLSGHMSVWCQVWEEFQRDFGCKSPSVSRFLLKTQGHWTQTHPLADYIYWSVTINDTSSYYICNERPQLDLKETCSLLYGRRVNGCSDKLKWYPPCSGTNYKSLIESQPVNVPFRRDLSLFTWLPGWCCH